jgi:hypothetical protein
MRHLTAELIMDYMDGRASENDKTVVETHAAACRDCAELKQELHSLMTQLESDSSFEPPADLLQWGVELFQPVLQAEPSGLRRIFASLIFDTFEQPAFAGVRRVGMPPRQLLFRAGEVDVDVKVEAMEANDRITLVGQILSGSAKFCDNIPVKLKTNQMVKFRTKTNLVGEFAFDEVPKDTYHLSVDLPEGQITLFCVHRGNS